jgi:phosphonate transport system substrate-binding protein
MRRTTLFAAISLLFLMACSDSKTSQRYEPKGETFNKKIYKIGIHPYLNSKKMFVSYRPILDYLEANLEGIEFILETSKDYPAYDKKLYAKIFDFSLPNPFQTYNSLQHGYKVVAKMKPDSVFRGIFVARKEHNLKSPKQLKGKAVSFPAPTALAATMMPLQYLHDHGINTNREIQKHFVGSQYSSILNAYSSDTLVGATWPPPWEAWSKENPDKAKEMEVVWQTQPLINNGFVVRNDLESAIVEKIVQLLINLDTTTQGKKLLRDAGFGGFEKADNRRYDIVKSFLERYNQSVGQE